MSQRGIDRAARLKELNFLNTRCKKYTKELNSIIQNDEAFADLIQYQEELEKATLEKKMSLSKELDGIKCLIGEVNILMKKEMTDENDLQLLKDKVDIVVKKISEFKKASKIQMKAYRDKEKGLLGEISSDNQMFESWDLSSITSKNTSYEYKSSKKSTTDIHQPTDNQCGDTKPTCHSAKISERAITDKKYGIDKPKCHSAKILRTTSKAEKLATDKMKSGGVLLKSFDRWETKPKPSNQQSTDVPLLVGLSLNSMNSEKLKTSPKFSSNLFSV